MKNKKLFIAILLVCGIFSFGRAFSETAGSGNTSSEKKLSNMDFVDAEISDVLRILAEEFQLNIVAGTDIKGKVTVSFNNVTLDDALASILRVNGYDYVKKDNIIRIIKLGQPGVETESRVFTLKHVDAANIKASLGAMISQYGSIETMVRRNGVGSERTKDRSKILVVTDVPGNLKKIEDVIIQLDTPSSQVLIEAKIVEVGLGQDKNLGIDWNVQAAVSGSKVPTTFPMANKNMNVGIPPAPSDGSFPQDKIFPYSNSGQFAFGALDFANFTAILQATQGKTDFNVLSSPSISTLDNQEARIVIGEVVPIPVYAYNIQRGGWEITGYSDQDVGITLTVTPHITPEGYVIMEIVPEVSEITGWITGPSGQNEKPIVSTRKADTQLKVKDGKTIVIGGLIKNKKTQTIKKVPLLGDIPLLGYLFRSKKDAIERTDLYVFVTPRVLTEETISEEVKKGESSLETKK
ncbi:MAG: secretin and TonB N-terminal domain-containing protein [bacterium]|nr:secretin and TonB N-terminal domain-containing protein [bacterium]